MPGVTTSARSLLPPARNGHDAPAELVERRTAAAGFPQPAPLEGVTVEPADRYGEGSILCTPPSPSATISYLHGGGFRLGSAASWTSWGTRLASATNARVLLVEYRLAPEGPYPAALDDALRATEALAADFDGPLFVAGDSAGGGLAASTVEALTVAGSVPVAGAILISPWADLTVSAATYESRAARDQLFSRQAALDGAELYLQGHDAADPYASPVFAPLASFPPSQIFVGTEEVLLDDAIALARRLGDAGRDVEVRIGAGMQHVWMTLFPDLEQSRHALDAMASFVRRVAGATAGG